MSTNHTNGIKKGDIVSITWLGKATVIRVNKSGTVRVSFWNRLDQLKQVTVPWRDCNAS